MNCPCTVRQTSIREEASPWEAAALPREKAQSSPAGIYTSPDFLDFETQAIFRKEWISLAHVSQVPNPGDYLRVDLCGEPMLVKDLAPFTQCLVADGRHLTIETAGTVDLEVEADLMSISPKLANSTPQDSEWTARHDARRHQPEVIRRLITEYDYQLKFVIDTPEDVVEVDRWLEEFPRVAADCIYLMAQATDREPLREKSAWLADIVKARGWRLSPRLHVELWGNTRGV